MKKMILFVMFVLAVAALADGTVRVYTGKDTWYFSLGDPPIFNPYANPAPTIDKGWPPNPWDLHWGYPPPPVRPWEKLYNQSPLDDGLWIGMSENGRDTSSFEDTDTVWFYSPTFTLEENISRATIWLAADDFIETAFLRDMGTGIAYAIPCVPVIRFSSLPRFDLTDFFREIACSLSGQGCRMEFRVRNYGCCYVGMIAYLSFDYGDSRNYTYNFNGSGWRHLSMPFKPTSPTATLGTLFPGAILGRFYDWETGSIQWINAGASLTGAVGDITRTYSISIMYFSGGDHTTTISGYPIFEQRYLDITTNNDLHFGTINCDCENPEHIGFVPFYGSDPDDFWPDKITGSDDSSFVSIGVDYDTPVLDVRPRRAYYAIPHPGCVDCDSPCLPYHLDLITWTCSGPMSLFSEECFSSSEEFLLGFPIDSLGRNIEAEVAMIRWMVDSLAPYIPTEEDISDTCAHCPGLHEGEPRPKESLKQLHLPILSVDIYPTPFNSELTVKVSVPNDDYLTVEIYTVAGNKVRTLFSGGVSSGDYSVVWDGLDASGNEMPSANYLVRVSTNTDKTTIKAILLK